MSAVAERDAEEAAHSSTKELGEECDDVGNDVERVWFVGEMPKLAMRSLPFGERLKTAKLKAMAARTERSVMTVLRNLAIQSVERLIGKV